MFKDLFSIATQKLDEVDDVAVGLPGAQVTVLYSANKKYYVAVNDVDGLICEELKTNNDTKMVRMITVWKSGGIDLSSFDFRKALVELNQENNDVDVILQGKDSLIIKKLSITMS